MLMDGHTSLLTEDGSAVDPNGLLGFWRQFGQVQALIYDNRYFDAKKEVKKLVDLLNKSSQSVDEIVVVGSSMGGLVSLDAVSQLAARVQNKIRLVLVDSPRSADDLWWPAALTARLASRFKFGLGPISARLPIWGRAPKRSMVQPGLRVRAVIREYMYRYRGMKLSLMCSQLAYMQNQPTDFSGVSKLNSIDYILCQDDYSIVRQPGAVKAWVSSLPGLIKAQEVKAPHCGYLLQPKAFEEAFERIFSRS